MLIIEVWDGATWRLWRRINHDQIDILTNHANGEQDIVYQCTPEATVIKVGEGPVVELRAGSEPVEVVILTERMRESQLCRFRHVTGRALMPR